MTSTGLWGTVGKILKTQGCKNCIHRLKNPLSDKDAIERGYNRLWKIIWSNITLISFNYWCKQVIRLCSLLLFNVAVTHPALGHYSFSKHPGLSVHWSLCQWSCLHPTCGAHSHGHTSDLVIINNCYPL